MTREVEVPINHGVSFERAREKLAALYGAAFRAYADAKGAGVDPGEVQALLDRARLAQADLRALRPSDTVRIAAILGESGT